ncbi:MAG: carboxypeptidase-like regulatory domain-containing protein [Candidatus Poribacteria bacterium]|nr:carboxypeptidase-like regulatory domain-containing protein [Candidatus Poribacteria bacterium]
MTAHRRAFTSFILALVVALMASAVAQECGVLRGRVLDGENGNPVAGTSVTLSWQEGNAPVSRDTTTDKSGAYEFGNLPLELGVSFNLSAQVNGKAVARSDVALSTWTPEVVTDIYPVVVTGHSADIHLGRLTVVVPPAQVSDGVEIIEFYQIHNPTGAPFTMKDDKGRTIGFRLDLPVGAENATLDGEGVTSQRDGDTMLVTSTLPAEGITLSVSYFLPRAATLNLTRKTRVLIDEAMILLGESTLKPTAAGFESTGPAAIHDETYATFTRSQVPADTILDIKMTTVAAGTSGGSMGGSPNQTGQPAASTGGVPMTLVLLVSVLSIVTGGFIGAWAMQSRLSGQLAAAASDSGATGFDPAALKRLKPNELDALKTYELERIAELDDRLDAGKLPKSVYARLRDEHKSRLAQIIERQSG